MHPRFSALAIALLAPTTPAAAQCWDQHLAAGITDPSLPGGVGVGPGRLALGQPRRNPTGSPQVDDIVRVFEGAPGSMVEVAVLSSSLAVQSNASFGTALDLDGDWLAVGDPNGFDPVLGDGGAVHLYERTPGGWVLRQVLFHPTVGVQFLTSFGTSLDLDGDLLAVGAPFATVATPLPVFETGVVFLFQRSLAGWTLLQTIAPPSPSSTAHFGRSVALDGDLLAIGSPAEPAGGGPLTTGEGVVHVYCRCALSQFSTLARLHAAAPARGAQLGWSVGIDGTVVVAGAPGVELAGEVAAGQAHVFEANAVGAWSETAVVSVPPIRAHQAFGDSVAVRGNDVYVTSSGMACAWRFSRSAGAWTRAARYTTEAGVAWPGSMPVRVSVTGSTVALSDPAGATLLQRAPLATAEQGCSAVPVPGVIPVPAYLDVRSELRLSNPTLELQVYGGFTLGSGVLFYGFAPASAPLGSAVRCVGGPLARAAFGAANPSATSTPLTLDLQSAPVSAGALAIAPGVEVHMQYWFRTSGGGTHLTNSLVLTFCP